MISAPVAAARRRRPCSPQWMKVIEALVEEQSVPEARVALASGISAFLYLFISIHGSLAHWSSFLPPSMASGSLASLVHNEARMSLLRRCDSSVLHDDLRRWVKDYIILSSLTLSIRSSKHSIYNYEVAAITIEREEMAEEILSGLLELARVEPSTEDRVDVATLAEASEAPEPFEDF
ncbi:uncharacterized protein A4U43_C07F15930 [Asparagus officinalis]|uniref:Uncharacterized protein n=1 Tax=Asparagus officinalis TaxID=4686 RepID=A0A5P1EE96_ASPOF|nr:uncharacterized protein A4U43_C07F15930 [Asparagus officinalis]